MQRRDEITRLEELMDVMHALRSRRRARVASASPV
jgi:hypothetical protein